ncbi:MAG TPA: hypothetical protein VLZ30_00500 [Verrucomicrobiae bacterium]|nr:hypothetical protein [Verrucomicrobiae bacterium]
MRTPEKRAWRTLAAVASLMFVLSSASVQLAIAGSDLTVTSVSAPASASLGSTISVVHATSNISSNPCATSTSKFYLSTNTFAYTSGLRNTQVLPALVGGGSVQETNRAFIIPTTATVGTYHIIVVCGFGIQDYNLSNNTNTTTTINITR